MTTLAALSVLLLAVAFAQQIGTNQAETHPTISIQQCTGSGQCQTQSRSIVLDSNWRWTHAVGGYTNCFTGNLWNETACPDPATCATNCAIDGADYEGTYGIKAGGNSVALKLVTVGQYDTNVGSRVYLMEDEEHYQMFKLKNREFTMDVDVSQLPCGLNGAVYFVEMDADGGMSKFPSNKAGAKYGTGYCDAQCPHDMKWINGEANLLDWTPDPNNKNSGVGKYGTCCNEMDIWEANSMATAYTPHVCSVNGQYRCSGTECGDNGADRYLGVCDKDGCDFNSYRLGNQDFFGEGKTVDTKQKVTVVTQFITADGTDTGDLSEIKRFYVQNGKVIPNSYISYSGNVSSTNSVTDKFCTEIKSFFGDNPAFEKKGGLKAMGESLERGVVLVMSLWDDYYAYMLWLDSSYPTDEPPTKPGVARGPCPTSSGRPQDVESKYPDSTVTYSNIKYGAINSTFSATFNF